MPARPERRARAFFLYQQSRIDLTRRIIHRYHEIEPRCLRQPRVPRCILMQHHARQRTARPLASVRTATRRLRQQIAALQKRLGPAVAPGKPMLSHQVLVEMPRREAPVAVRYRCSTSSHRSTGTRLPTAANPAVQQPGLALLLVTTAPTAERPAPPCPAILPPPVGSVQTPPSGARHIHELRHTNTLSGFRQAHPPEPPGWEPATGQFVCYLNRSYRLLPTPEHRARTERTDHALQKPDRLIRLATRQPSTLNGYLPENI